MSNFVKDENFVRITGRLGKDPVVRRVGVKEVIEITIATGGGKSKDGQKTYETEWHDIKCWSDSNAYEAVAHALKGGKLTVEGYLKTEKWNDKNSGEEKRKKVIMAKEAYIPESGSQPAKTAKVDSSSPF
jgi:single-strand DNA-binding protein